LSFTAHFGLDLTFGLDLAEAKGEHQSVISHLKKIVDEEKTFPQREKANEEDLSGPIFVVGCTAVAFIIIGF
jgi:hypothetical protein